ncbi:hypothetical protein [Burkholderia gladioli]|uniref:hypothetical protein n=1 Tax=Burkholderia gladioli TaxID=28095 RepID=UPI00163E0EAC|nr:hypothetical protein [Burkholderia gladioli]
MKATHKLIATRIALFTCVTASLTACGHGSPSETDAKAAIEARLGNCKYFKVSSFEKTNGVSVGDNDYNVDIKYTVSLLPDHELKARLVEDKDLFEKANLIKADYNARLSALQKEHDTIMAERDGKDPTFDAVAEDARFENLRASDPVLVKDMNDVKGIAAKIGPVSAMGLFERAVAQQCPNMHVRNDFLLTYFNPGTSIDQLIDGTNAEFTETMPMQKTDNGWLEVR